MSNERIYSAVILSENLKKDTYFKSFLRSSSFFAVLQHVHHSEIASRSGLFDTVDHIFFSDELSETLLGEIKTKIKSNYTILTKPKIILYSLKEHIPRRKLIRSLIAGANAFVVAPFTHSTLAEACDFSQKIPPDEASQTRLKIAVRMMIQDSVDESETPSMVHKIPDETKQYFKELGDKNLSSNLVQYLSNLTHVNRIGTYEHLHTKVQRFIKERIKNHLDG